MDSSLFRWGDVGDCDADVHSSSDEKDPATLFANFRLMHPKSCFEIAISVKASSH